MSSSCLASIHCYSTGCQAAAYTNFMYKSWYLIWSYKYIVYFHYFHQMSPNLQIRLQGSASGDLQTGLCRDYCKASCSRLVLNDPNGVLCRELSITWWFRSLEIYNEAIRNIRSCATSFIRCFSRFCRIRQEATYRNRWGQEREMQDLSETKTQHTHENCNCQL